MASDPWGGSESLWAESAAKLIEKGHQVTACVWRWPVRAPQLERLVKSGCRLHEYSVSPVAIRLLQKFGAQKDWGFRWLSRSKPDLAVISDGGAYTVGPFGLRCSRLGIRYAIVAQAATESTWPSGAALDLLRQAYAKAERCYFVSNRNRELVETQLGMDLPNAEVVRNPFNVPYDRDFTWPDEAGPTRIACVGRLSINAKGQDLLLKVWNRPEWRSRPVELSIIGKGEHRQCLDWMVQRLELTRVNFTGFVPDVASIWDTHHALILPSRFEGLPLAVVEAALCGRVCIVTDVAGNRELLTEGQTGFLAAAPTDYLLGEAMERAWMRRGDWREIGRRAYVESRNLIPRDPAGNFAERLISLVKRS